MSQLGLPPNSQLIVSRLEEAWSTFFFFFFFFSLLVAEKNKIKKSTGEVTQSVTDRPLTAGFCGNAGHPNARWSFIDLKYDLSSEICKY